MKSASAPRTCEHCTACCDGWVTMNVRGHEVLPGSPCPFSTGKGCKIYDERPEDPCRLFVCGWMREGSPLPEWFRPDLAKVIVLPAVRSWRNLAVDVAVPVGKKIPGKAMNWLKVFATQHGRPFIYTEQQQGALGREQVVAAFGPPEFQRDVAELVARGEKLW